MNFFEKLFNIQNVNTKDNEIKEIVEKKTCVLGNKVYCILGFLYIVLLSLQTYIFFDKISSYSDTKNTLMALVMITIFYLVILILCIKTNYETKKTKVIILIMTIVISLMGIINKVLPDDMIITFIFFLVTIAYLDYKFTTLIGLITFVCIVINIMQFYLSYGDVENVIFDDYFHGVTAILMYVSSIIIAKYCYNVMVKDEIDNRSKIIEQRDFYLANKIQSGFLKHDFPNNDNYAINACMYPSKEVGGDFYDFFKINSNKMVLIIADVSGKGIPASLFMATLKTLFYANLHYGLSFEKVIEKTNRLVVENNPEMQFVTLFLAEIDLSTGKMYYVNAGHTKPCLISNEGEVSFINTKSDFVFGVRKDARYHIYERQLNIGDKLFLYTDGVSERKNKEDLLYGAERLVNVLKKNSEQTVEYIVKAVKDDLDVYANGTDQNDDITCLVFEYKKQKFIEKHIVKNFELEKDEYKDMINFVEKVLKEKNVPEKIIGIMKVVADEIISNITKFAYKESDKEKNLRLSIQVMDNIVEMVFIDNGKYFNPLLKVNRVKTNKITKNSPLGGLGIKMTWNMMDDMNYSRVEKYNILTVVKEF